MVQATYAKDAKKIKKTPQETWQPGEVEPLDIGKPYQPVARPLITPEPTLSLLPNEPLTNQIYQGDCLKTLKSWPDNSFDACVTDPPYNIAKDHKGLAWAFSTHVTITNEWDRFSKKEYDQFTLCWLKEVCRVTKENGNIFIFGSYHNIYTIGAIAAYLDLRVINSIIWFKPNAQPNITCRMFTESTEQILWLCNNTNKKATKWTFNYHQMKELNHNKQMRNFWEIPLTPSREKTSGKHPSQKPIKLMERILLAGTNKADSVLDCFAGSGSTLLAADRLERKWVGIEQSKTYCDIAHSRIQKDRQLRREQKH